MPPRKRPTKSTDPTDTPTAATPAVTPNTALPAKKAAAAAAPKVEKKAAAKRTPTKKTKPGLADVAPVSAVASVAEAVPSVAESARISVPLTSETSSAPVRSVISDDDIRRLAYQLSQGRRGPGDPLADWFEAERQLREQRA